jgi:hypothetical protein
MMSLPLHSSFACIFTFIYRKILELYQKIWPTNVFPNHEAVYFQKQNHGAVISKMAAPFVSA